jgi:hypothetical protein
MHESHAVEEARRQIQYLLTVEELRHCAVAVIVNNRRDNPYDSQKDSLEHKLGLSSLGIEVRGVNSILGKTG